MEIRRDIAGGMDYENVSEEKNEKMAGVAAGFLHDGYLYGGYLFPRDMAGQCGGDSR